MKPQPEKAPRKHLSENAGMRAVMPIGRSGFAITAGYLGLCSVIPGVGILAILFGILAIVHVSKNPLKHGMGRAIFGIVAGLISIVVYVIIGLEQNVF